MTTLKKLNNLLVLTIISLLIFSCKKDKDENLPKPYGNFRITQIDVVEGDTVVWFTKFEYSGNQLSKIFYSPQDNYYYQLVHETGESSIQNLAGYIFSKIFFNDARMPTQIESHYYDVFGPLVFSLNSDNKADSIYFADCPSCGPQYFFTYSDSSISSVHDYWVNEKKYTYNFKHDQLVEINSEYINDTWSYQLEYESDMLRRFTQVDPLIKWSYTYYTDKIIRKELGTDKETIFHIEKEAIEIESLYFMVYAVFQQDDLFHYFPLIEKLGSMVMLLPRK